MVLPGGGKTSLFPGKVYVITVPQSHYLMPLSLLLLLSPQQVLRYRVRKSNTKKMQSWVSMFPEGGPSGIPDDRVSKNPEGGVIVFSLGGAALLKKWLLPY